MPTYSRVLLKLSGEWFSGEKEKGFDQSTFEIVSQTIKKTSDTQLAIVLGGGNIFRGKELKNLNIDQVSADYIGMLSTIMNGIALSNYLTSQDCKNSLFSSFAIGNFVKAYSKEEADNALESNNTVLLVGGLGNPLFTTDSTASVRAVELNSNIMLKATNVDGVFSTDPKIDANAKKYKNLTFNEAINKNLKVMDQTSLCFCRDYGLNVRVFDANQKNALISAINGDEIGTLVHD